MGRDINLFLEGYRLSVWVQGIFLTKFSCNNKLDKLGFVSFVCLEKGMNGIFLSLFMKKKKKKKFGSLHSISLFFACFRISIKLYLCYNLLPFPKTGMDG